MSLATVALSTPGLLALALGWIGGWVVYSAAPRKPANRLLAIIIILEGMGVGLARGVDPLLSGFVNKFALSALVAACMMAGTLLYLMFCSQLDTPLAKPLRGRALPLVGAVAVIAAWSYLFANPDKLRSIYFTGFRVWASVALVGFVVALDAWRRAPRGSQTRRQMKAYTMAFGVRDVGWFSYIWLLYPAVGVQERISPIWGPFFAVYAPLITISFLALFAYGVLRTQLFDVDLRIKKGVRRGTVAAGFVAVFFAASEGAALLVQDRTGSALVGIAVASLLVFALAPLQRAAERLSDMAMPGVRDTEEYRLVRKREVYRAAVESAARDGAITDKERDVLATLADQMGLSVRESLEVEREVAAAS